MKRKIEIQKHGDFYIPKQKEILICPECGMIIENYTSNEEGEWLPLEIAYWNTIYLNVECPNCHCKFSQKQKAWLDEYNIEKMCGLAILIAGIVFGICFIINYITNSEDIEKLVLDIIGSIIGIFLGVAIISE